MYTRKENQKQLNNSESGPKDISENQLVVFHVEHNWHNINALELYNPKFYNMKKFKATSVNRMEYLFSPYLSQAQDMWNQLYPGTPVQIEEVERKIHE
jgi:hypothetical protein